MRSADISVVYMSHGPTVFQYTLTPVPILGHGSNIFLAHVIGRDSLSVCCVGGPSVIVYHPGSMWSWLHGVLKPPTARMVLSACAMIVPCG